VPTSAPIATEPIRIVVHFGRDSRALSRLEELLTALIAQTDSNWHLTILTWRPSSASELIGLFGDQLARRVVVVAAWSSRAWTSRHRATVSLHVSDVPLSHLVGLVRHNVAGDSWPLPRYVDQPVELVGWPSGVAGWSPVGPPAITREPVLGDRSGVAGLGEAAVLRRRRSGPQSAQ
jgi:hypothetical protein